MLDQLKALLTGGTSPQGPDALRTAVAALLVEAAWSSGGFDPLEQAKIETLLQDRFAISAADAQALVAAGDHAGRQHTHLLSFTKRVLDGMSPDQRVEMIEMLWEVAFADGRLDPDEELLIAKVAGLLYVSASDRNAAKRRAMQRAGLS